MCWLLPAHEMWDQYEKEKVTESELVRWSIDQFRHNKSGLERAHPHDLSEEIGKNIFKKILQEHSAELSRKHMKIII